MLFNFGYDAYRVVFLASTTDGGWPQTITLSRTITGFKLIRIILSNSESPARELSYYVPAVDVSYNVRYVINNTWPPINAYISMQCHFISQTQFSIDETLSSNWAFGSLQLLGYY